MAEHAPHAEHSPDPTFLTVEMLQREIRQLERLTDQKAERNNETCLEKFNSVDEKLALIERQRVEQKQDTEKAVQAALSAAKEAVKEQTTASETSTNKSEAATTKSIDQLGETFNTAIDGLRRELGDAKEKITSIEQRKAGGQEARSVAQETRQGLSTTASLVIAGVGVFLLLISVAVAVVALASTP